MAAHIRRRPFLAGIVAVLLVIVLFFGGRATWRLVDRLLGPPPPPRQTDVSLIADWMSVPYISRVYRVPRAEMYTALGFAPDGPQGRDRRSLRDLAQEQGRSSAELVQLVQETVLAWQASHPEPPRPSPPPNAPPSPVLAPPKPGEPQPPSPIPLPAALLTPEGASPARSPLVMAHG